MNKDKVLNGLNKILSEDDRKPRRSVDGDTIPHLKWMIKQMKTKEFSVEKWNRWLGYIQGMMVAYELTSLNKERKRNK